MGSEHFLDHLRSHDGHPDCLDVHLLSPLPRILEMVDRNGIVLLHTNVHPKHFSALISRRICLGLSWVSISNGSIPQDKWLLLLRACWRCFTCSAWVQNARFLMDVVLRLSHVVHVDLVDDSALIALLNWYDFRPRFCSLLLHDCSVFPGTCWF